MDDARPRLPEARPVARRRALQEVVHLLVLIDCGQQVGPRPHAGLDQVVAVHRRRCLHAAQAGQLELQQRHLPRRVLQRDPVCFQRGVVGPPRQPLRRRVGHVPEEDLLRQRQRTPQPPPPHRDRRRRARVRPPDALDRVWFVDGHRCSSPHAAAPATRRDALRRGPSATKAATGRHSINRAPARCIAAHSGRGAPSMGGRPVRALAYQSGMLPCFFGGLWSDLFFSISSARMISGRVSCGSITSSM